MSHQQVIPMREFLKDHVHEQERHIPKNTKTLIPAKNRLEVWAAKNACTLIVLTLFFFITWILFLLTSYGVLGNG